MIRSKNIEGQSIGEHPAPCRLAMITNHPLASLGLLQFIREIRPDHVCVMETTSWSQLQKRIKKGDIHTVVVAVDERSGDLSGVMAQQQLLHERSPASNTLVYTASRDATQLASLELQPHVSLIASYEPLEQLRQDIALALDGYKVCSVSIRAEIARNLRVAPRSGLKPLTHAEQQVLVYLMAGMCLSDIASLLQRSVKTISAHKCNSMRKLGVSTDAELFQIPYSEIVPAGHYMHPSQDR